MWGPDDFLPLYYLRSYPELGAITGHRCDLAYKHYLDQGVAEGRSPNPFFVPSYYLARYPDLLGPAGNETRALEHWIRLGIDEGRRGSSVFDPAFYLQSGSDLIRALGRGNFRAAYGHWLALGIIEGRQSNPEQPCAVVKDPQELLLGTHSRLPGEDDSDLVVTVRIRR